MTNTYCDKCGIDVNNLGGLNLSFKERYLILKFIEAVYRGVEDYGGEIHYFTFGEETNKAINKLEEVLLNE